MRKAVLFVLVAVFAAAGSMTQGTMAQEEKPQKTAAAPKEGRWHGVIVRINERTSSMDVRKGTITRAIYFDSSTQWTQGTKPADRSLYKEGSNVICLGTFDEKGKFHATRVDLRTPKL